MNMQKFKDIFINIKDWFVKVFKNIGSFFVFIGTKIKNGTLSLVDKTKTAINNKKSKKEKSKQQKENDFNSEEESEEKDNKKTVIIILLIIIIILLLFNFFAILGSRGGISKNNAKTIAGNYADFEEYDRALNVLDAYLLKNPNDKDAWELWNEIVAKKDEKENGSYVVNNNADDLNEFNTIEISNAMQDSMDSMKRALQLYNNQVESQAENNRKLMEELQQLRNSQTDADAIKKQADAALAELEAERKAREAAAEAQRKLEEEKRKAEEDKLAKEDSELKGQFDILNNEIQKGKNALSTGNANGGINYFNNAVTLIPAGAGKQFSADKKGDMALSLYEASDKAGTTEDKNKLLNSAISMANDALKDDPDNSLAHYVLAQNLINNKNYNDALKELTSAVEHAKADDLNRYLYYYELGKLQYRLKKFNEAANSFQTSCDLKNDFTPSRFNLGLTQKQLKNENAALAAFRKTIDIDPRYEKAYLEEARILAARNDYSGAIDAYKSCLKVNNVNVQAAMELGSVYYKKRDLANAEDMYRRALTMLGPSEELTLTKFNLSTVLYDSGKVDEAVKYAKEAYDERDYLKNKIQKANLIYNYALVLDKTGSVSKAIPVYGDVLKYNPDHLKAKINLGVIYMTINPPEVDKALQYFLEVYTKENNNFEANNNLGSAYLLKEDYKNAIKFFQNAIKLDPKNNDVRANLAKAYARNGDYDNAKTTYTELLKQDVNNWDAYVELAKVCMQLNDNTSAEKYLIYVQEKNPSYRMNEVNNLLKAIK